MNITLFLTVFSVLAVVYLIIGIFASKNIKNNNDYFLANRSLGFGFLVATLLATQIGGGVILGTAKEAYFVGYYGIFYSLGLALGFLVLGFGFAAKLRDFDIVTTAELFEKKYKSKFLRKVASAISALSLCGILIGTVVGSRESFLGLGIRNESVLIIFWLFIMLYTVIGGLRAVVATDIFQVGFIIIVLGGVFFYLVGSDSVFLITPTAFISSEKLSFSRLLNILLMPFLLAFVEQDLSQRFFAAKSRKIAALSALTSGVLLVLFSYIPVYLGMKARLMGLVIPLGESPLVVLIERVFGEFVVVLVMCAIFAAIVSTADSLLCAISSNIAQDFNFSFLGIKNNLKFSQLITFLVGSFALIVAYRFDNVIEVLVESYEIIITSLLVSVMFCFFKKKLAKEAAAFSMFVMMFIPSALTTF